MLVDKWGDMTFETPLKKTGRLLGIPLCHLLLKMNKNVSPQTLYAFILKTNALKIMAVEKSIFPNTKYYNLYDFAFRPELYNYKSGTYHFTLEASVAFGTKTIADFDFELE